jgi:hypothetical protein
MAGERSECGQLLCQITQVEAHISALEEAEEVKGNILTVNKDSIPEHIQQIMKEAKIQAKQHAQKLMKSRMGAVESWETLEALGALSIEDDSFSCPGPSSKRSAIKVVDLCSRLWGL